MTYFTVMLLAVSSIVLIIVFVTRNLNPKEDDHSDSLNVDSPNLTEESKMGDRNHDVNNHIVMAYY